MARSVIGGLAEGYVLGRRLKMEQEEADQRRERIKKQDARQDVIDARDAERFEAEKGRMAEEKSQRAARASFDAELKKIRDDAARGINGYERFGFAGQPQQQAAIAGPDGQTQQFSTNPFMAVGDGMYRNQRGADMFTAERRAQALENLYASIGQPEKAMFAREEVLKNFDNNVERKLKTALSGAAAGAPGGLEAISRAYEYLNDGKKINPASGQWDPKTLSYKGVEFLDQDGKVIAKQDITQQAILGLAKQDAAALALFNTEQAWKERDFGLKERQTKADERRADAAVTTSQAQLSRANALNLRERSDANGSQQKAMVEAVANMFPLVKKDYKPEELMLEKDKGAGKLAAQEREKRMMNKTLDLAGLNPRVDVRTLAGLARQGKVDAQEDDDGRIFTMVGSTKVYLR